MRYCPSADAGPTHLKSLKPCNDNVSKYGARSMESQQVGQMYVDANNRVLLPYPQDEFE